MKIELKPAKMNIEFKLQKVFPELEDLTVTPSNEQQTFNHPNSYGYDEVIVEKIPITVEDEILTFGYHVTVSEGVLEV